VRFLPSLELFYEDPDLAATVSARVRRNLYIALRLLTFPEQHVSWCGGIGGWKGGVVVSARPLIRPQVLFEARGTPIFGTDTPFLGSGSPPFGVGRSPSAAGRRRTQP
jgi:hypothetical protein